MAKQKAVKTAETVVQVEQEEMENRTFVAPSRWTKYIAGEAPAPYLKIGHRFLRMEAIATAFYQPSFKTTHADGKESEQPADISLHTGEHFLTSFRGREADALYDYLKTNCIELLPAVTADPKADADGVQSRESA